MRVWEVFQGEHKRQEEPFRWRRKMAFVTDPISDLLTRIRNAQLARHAYAEIPGSKIKYEITKILEKHGYVESTQWLDEGYQGKIRVAEPLGEPGQWRVNAWVKQAILLFFRVSKVKLFKVDRLKRYPTAVPRLLTYDV